MLKTFRNKKVAKMVLWGLLILILPAFVLWGTGNLRSSGSRGPKFVGIVNNKKVSFDDLADSITAIRCQIVLNYYAQPQVIRELVKNKALIGKMAWDRLLMLSEAKKKRMKVGESEMINYIRSHPLFLRDGKFDEQIYGYILRNDIGLEPRSFEDIVKENLEIRKMNEDMVKDAKVADDEVLANYKIHNERYKIAYILLAEQAASSEESAGLISKKIRETMAKDKVSFEKAATASVPAGIKIQETGLFSNTDYLEGLGEASQLTGEAAGMKIGEVSKAVPVRKGYVIFKLADIQKFDEEKFKKEKDEFAKLVLAQKKNGILGNWLKGLESRATLNISFDDYEKYYR